MLEPLLQEVNNNPCDTGVEEADLLQHFTPSERHVLNTTALFKKWYRKTFQTDEQQQEYVRSKNAKFLQKLRQEVLAGQHRL